MLGDDGQCLLVDLLLLSFGKAERILVDVRMETDFVMGPGPQLLAHTGMEEVGGSGHEEGRGDFFAIEEREDSRHARPRTVFAAGHIGRGEIAGEAQPHRFGIDVERKRNRNLGTPRPGFRSQILAGANLPDPLVHGRFVPLPGRRVVSNCRPGQEQGEDP